MPRFISPPTLICLWILLGLVAAGGAVAWWSRVPVYAAGPALVVAGPGGASFIPPAYRDEILVAAFLPPERLERLRVGQTIFFQFERADGRLSGQIIAVAPEVVSPEAARRQLALSAGAASVITQPAAVAIARYEPPHSGLPAAAYVGSTCRAKVEVGSRRALSLLPFIGSFVGE